MPKESVNSKISHPNIYGRVIQHDIWLNQSVVTTSSPTFASLAVSGDTTIGGNLYVLGNTSVFNTEITEFEDNILLVNKAETSAGVTLNQAGLEIERGTLENARIVFNEPDDTIRIGLVSGLQAVATREDNPLLSGVMLWNDTLKRLDSSDTITIPVSFTSTSDSAVSITGGLRLVGPSQNATVDVTSGNNLIVTAPSDIDLRYSNNLIVPINKPIAFGSTVQTLLVQDTSANFVFTTPGNIDFDLQAGKSIKIPTNTKLTLSTVSDDAYLGNDSTDGTILQSTRSISIVPTTGSRVLFPNAIRVTYGDTANAITGSSGSLIIDAGNQVIVPNARFGTTGTQTITTDSASNLKVSASNDIFLSASRVAVTAGTLLMLADTGVSISGNNSQALAITATTARLSGKLAIASTENSAAGGTLGALRVEGGISAALQVLTTDSVQVNSTSASSLLVRNTLGNILQVSSNRTVGSVTISAGNGDTQAALLITSNSNAVLDNNLVQFRANSDTTDGYSLGRDTIRTLRLNIPAYTAYSSSGTVPSLGVYAGTTNVASVDSFGRTSVRSTENSASVSTGALAVSGGLGVSKDVTTSGRISSAVNSTSAVVVSDGSGVEVYRLDTVGKTMYSDAIVSVTNSTESSSTSAGALLVKGGAVIEKKLRVLGQTDLYETLVMNSKKIQNVANPVDPQDAATKNYVDLYIQGISVKQSVSVATLSPGTLATGYFTGQVIDSYTLQTNDTILIKNQASSIENGIYIVNGPAAAPTRTLDYATGDHASGTFVFVRGGVINKNMGFICNSPQSADTIGTDPLSFTQFTGLGQIDPGSGLSSNANQLNVNVDDTSIEVFSDTLRIKSGAVGTGLTGGSGVVLSTTTDQSHVTRVGTLTNGVWNASVINVPYGGTGQSMFTSGHLVFGNGSSALRSSSKLYFNVTTGNLGLGNLSPDSNVTVTSTSMATLLLHSDSAGADTDVYPGVTLRHGTGGKEISLRVARSQGSLLAGTLQDSGVLAVSDALHISTTDTIRMTVSSTGNVGINKILPTSTLDILGTLAVSGTSMLGSNVDSTSSSTGALQVSGGAGIVKRLNVGGITTVYSTTPSTNVSSGALQVTGGVSVAETSNATSTSNGGALTVGGGASIAKDMYIGGGLTAGNTRVTGDIYAEGNATVLDRVSLVTGNVSVRSTDSNLVFLVNNAPTVTITSAGNTTITGTVAVQSAIAASGTSTAGLLVSGGVNIRSNAIIAAGVVVGSTQDATTLSTGALQVSGGASVNKSLVVGGDTSVTGKSLHSRNAMMVSITNTNVSTAAWVYIGIVTRIDMSLENLDFSLAGTTATHSFTRDAPDSNIVVFQDTGPVYHLFCLLGTNRTRSLRVHSSDTVPTVAYEGVGVAPSGTTSGYTGSWTQFYTTLAAVANQATNTGDIVCAGVKSSDGVPLFGYDYTETPARSLGTAYQLTLDEITGFASVLADTIPAQTGTTLFQTKLSSSANATDSFYNGWFAVSGGQKRLVTSYNGAQRVLGLETAWTIAPVEDDTVELYNRANVAVRYTGGSFVTSFNTGSLVEQALTDLRTGNVSCGNLVGTSVTLSSSTNASSTNASVFTEGGITAKRSVYAEKLKLGANASVSSTVSVDVYENASTVRLNSTVGSYSYIDFARESDLNRFGIMHSGASLLLTANNTGNAPNLTGNTAGLAITSSGRVGINCTSNIDSPLTIAPSMITTNTNTDYLGISGGRTDTSGGNIVLYGGSHASSAGSVFISASRTNVIGGVLLQNTMASTNSTTGGLMVLGGVSISNTNNATSVTSGGAFTVAGGVAVKQDLYVGGSIVTGSLTVIGLNSAPPLTFTNTSNCSVSAYGSSSLALIGTEALLSFYVNIVPINANEKTEFQFNIPSRTTVLPQRGDIASSCSGWTDDTELYVIQNILCTGVQGTTRALVKFQSLSTVMHVIQIISRYTPV